MNEHVPEHIRQKWINYEFTGKPIKLSDGKTYMRAWSKTFEKTHFYCFETDFFWHERPPITSNLTNTKSLIES